MKYLINQKFILFFLVSIFLIFKSKIILCIKKDFPNEIKNNLPLLSSLISGEAFRFSQCFLCYAYTSLNIKKRNLCLFNNKIYEFDNSTNYTNEFDLSNNVKSSYYNLLINRKDDKLYYLISYIGQNKHLNLFYYTFFYKTEGNFFNKSNEVDNKIIDNQGLYTCQIYTDDILICFYILKPKLCAEIFNINNNFTSQKIINTSCECEDINNTIITMKSSKITLGDQILVFWEQRDNHNAYSITYKYDSGFGKLNTFKECDTNSQLIYTCYYPPYFYFICIMKEESKKFIYYKKHFDDYSFENGNEFEIQDNGFLVIENAHRFYNKSNEICNLSSYATNNYPDENIICQKNIK